ncbi:E3 ubiquitin-protein ligase MPSR1 [Colletotrichum orbiculare MAFF 240422]|uniref:E3 ubiquitin-protein ligase MPSR1 n=1 Tax=Colletotrichum orbiculare (strain 104-T / ATCC 96160 / CBS 514.97 / LARS 414 / MAFF 240422) TaxID=1213857 RepID=A0A484FAD5_COLOR|nr:E3 ubiquitin-protein ligase MPSR1 [Colletotrichum orbiculare MAFF 240422]
MDDTMDYAYHHRSEQQPNHGQLPYPQPMSRCPYAHQSHPAMVPHRSTVPYDPVHSANNWPPQPSPMPAHWNPHMAGHRGPYMQLPNSPPEPSYYGHPPLPTYPPLMPGYPLPSYDPLGLHSSHSAYHASMPPLPPPARFGNAVPMQSHPPLPNPGSYTTSERLSNHTLPQRIGYEVSSAAAPTAAETSTTSTAPAQNPSTPGEDTPSATEPITSEPPASVNIQFGSAPPSGAPQSNNPAVTLSAYRSQRPSAAEEPPAIAHSQRAAIDERSRLPIDSASTTSATSAGTSGTATHSYERRRAPQNARRTYPRRQSPPSDREYDNENEMRMLEQLIAHGGARLLGHDLEENHVRATQFLRGSVSTKMVASDEAILSLQSVPISELPEGETACVICYNEYGVETPEGVKEAPLRLPKCKHTFGDHCIKKWLADSDSCPYCRDKIPSHPRLTSNAPGFNGLFRTRALLRERGESAYGHDESNRRITPENPGSIWQLPRAWVSIIQWIASRIWTDVVCKS